jgi:hypothetical protein
LQPSGTDASGTVLPFNTVRELAKEALLMSKLRHPNGAIYAHAMLHAANALPQLHPAAISS